MDRYRRFPVWYDNLSEKCNHRGLVAIRQSFFSVPALLFLAYWRGGVEKDAWIWSTVLFAVLTIISAVWLPADANVNSAHRLWPGLDQLHLAALEQLPKGWYPVIVVALNGLGNYLPVNLVLRVVYHYLLKRTHKFKQTNTALHK